MLIFTVAKPPVLPIGEEKGVFMDRMRHLDYSKKEEVESFNQLINTDYKPYVKNYGTNEDGTNIIHIAVLYTNRKILESILTIVGKGKINEQNRNGYTPLHYAAMHKKELYRFLVENGADENIENYQHKTPRDYLDFKNK